MSLNSVVNPVSANRSLWRRLMPGCADSLSLMCGSFTFLPVSRCAAYVDAGLRCRGIFSSRELASVSLAISDHCPCIFEYSYEFSSSCFSARCSAPAGGCPDVSNVVKARYLVKTTEIPWLRTAKTGLAQGLNESGSPTERGSSNAQNPVPIISGKGEILSAAGSRNCGAGLACRVRPLLRVGSRCRGST